MTLEKISYLKFHSMEQNADISYPIKFDFQIEILFFCEFISEYYEIFRKSGCSKN